MKKEYDFSNGTRGKFYKKGIQLRLPIYLDLDLQHKLESMASKRHKALNEMVSNLLRKEIQLVSN